MFMGLTVLMTTMPILMRMRTVLATIHDENTGTTMVMVVAAMIMIPVGTIGAVAAMTMLVKKMMTRERIRRRGRLKN
jgi:hypothetical protein